MKDSNQRLAAHLDFGLGESIHLGDCIWSTQSQSVSFKWSGDALAMTYRLSLIDRPNKGILVAKREPFEGLPGFLSDSIPDGFGLRMMNNSFKKAGYELRDVNQVHRLAWVGSSGLGAMKYAPAFDFAFSKELLDIKDLGIYAKKADIDKFEEIPKAAIHAGGSAHGARPKFWGWLHQNGSSMVIGGDDEIYKDYTPSLIKFAPANGDKNEPFFEKTCIDLANRYGVLAVNARLLNHDVGAALAVERFDRVKNGERFFIQSLAALLNVDFRVLSNDYLDLFEVSKRLSLEPESERIYRQACFNVALSIKDDHSKNFAFMMGRDGKWSLSPAFDLCPNLGPSGWRSMSVCGEAKNVKREHLIALAKKMQLSDEIAKDGIAKACEASSQFALLALQLGAQKKATKEWEKLLNQIQKDLK